ncbi:AlbA family DNA-binding domain-containing protein [Curtobacterium flaccumfaciens]|uniref:AlbA family DNA-binding domain-containing protein n=1 Tax=Curtobacterium flaccumfaciens TaxID=2035 RepID=UPI003CEE63EE
MTHDPKPSRYQKTSEDAELMLALGESGRFEFKRDVDAVSVKLLATLANWVALDPDREVAHLLVGVQEVEDRATGLVWGEPRGLPKGLDKAVARIQDLASQTRPVPVEAFVVEENVSGVTPFVRVEVRPTMPPHYDNEGRRQTRQGRSTRALTDDELLRVYLDREAGSFAARFKQAGEELRSAVGAIGDQVDDVAAAIEETIAEPLGALTMTAETAADAARSAESSADSANASAMSTEYEVSNVRDVVRALQTVVEHLRDQAPDNLAFQLVMSRRKVWWNFTVDTYRHTSALSNRLEERLRALLARDISIDATQSGWELGLWESVLDGRMARPRQRGTQKWWHATLETIETYLSSPSYAAPDLPGLRAALRADLDRELDDPKSATRTFEALLKD